MRIIKQGTPPPKEITTTCIFCDTTFAYTPADVISDSRDGNFVKCPNCDKGLAAKSFDIPFNFNKPLMKMDEDAVSRAVKALRGIAKDKFQSGANRDVVDFYDNLADELENK